MYLLFKSFSVLDVVAVINCHQYLLRPAEELLTSPGPLTGDATPAPTEWRYPGPWVSSDVSGLWARGWPSVTLMLWSTHHCGSGSKQGECSPWTAPQHILRSCLGWQLTEGLRGLLGLKPCGKRQVEEGIRRPSHNSQGPKV